MDAAEPSKLHSLHYVQPLSWKDKRLIQTCKNNIKRYFKFLIERDFNINDLIHFVVIKLNLL